MPGATSDRRAELLETTYLAALISGGLIALSAAVLQDRAIRYVFFLLGAALLVSGVLRLQGRIARFILSRRGFGYARFTLVALPVGMAAISLVLVIYFWLGTASGILDSSSYLLPFTGSIGAVLINLGMLTYNLIESRR